VPTAAKTTIARTSSARASASNTSPSFTTAPKVSFPFVAGIVTGSVSLVGFGLDSVIEVFSGAAFPDPAQFGNRSTFDTTLPCQHGIMFGLGYPYKGQVGF